MMITAISTTGATMTGIITGTIWTTGLTATVNDIDYDNYDDWEDYYFGDSIDDDYYYDDYYHDYYDYDEYCR